jgi:hypothetical protein
MATANSRWTECTDGVGPDDSEQPRDQENDGYGVQHRDLPSACEFVSPPKTGGGGSATLTAWRNR